MNSVEELLKEVVGDMKDTVKLTKRELLLGALCGFMSGMVCGLLMSMHCKAKKNCCKGVCCSENACEEVEETENSKKKSCCRK